MFLYSSYHTTHTTKAQSRAFFVVLILLGTIAWRVGL